MRIISYDNRVVNSGASTLTKFASFVGEGGYRG